MSEQVTEEKKEQPKVALEDWCAGEYQRLLPLYRKKIDELNNRSLKKVSQALMEYPLERIEFQWSYPEEKEAFIIGTKLMDARFVIIKAALDLKQDEIRELLKPTKQEETVIVDKTE
jgi:hypothetical protein